MYSRMSNKDPRIPSNYGGSMFGARPMPKTPVEDLTRHRPTPPEPVPQPDCTPDLPPDCAPDYPPEPECKCPLQNSTPKDAPKPILAPLGALGTEELLLIALALIVFQGGSEPELALILLALLFIS